jgi:hypothetical protein
MSERIKPEGDFGAVDRFGLEKSRADKIWEWINAEGFFGAFDRFRRGNAEYRVMGHKLAHFFPRQRTQRWMVEFEILGLDLNDNVAVRDAARNWEKLDTDLRLAVITLVGRALSTTVDEHLALVPNTAKDGDILAIVACPFPIVLRPKQYGYEYIGECYVHGFMDGEAFIGKELPEVEKFLLR